MHALSKRPHPAFGQAPGPDSTFSYRQITREDHLHVGALSTACPRAPRQPLTLHHMVTQRFREVMPQAWASELLGAVQEGMPSTPSRHLAPVPPNPHFSHTQQWGPVPPSHTQERQDQAGTPECWLRPGKGRDESLPSADAGTWGGAVRPQLRTRAQSSDSGLAR